MRRGTKRIIRVSRLMRLLTSAHPMRAAKPDDLDVGLAYRLVIASNCAYEHSPNDALTCLKNTPEFTGIADEQIILKSDLGPEKLDGYLLINSPGKDLILAIRGTQPPINKNSEPGRIALDWLNDFMLGQFVPPAFEKDGYHEGFLKVWSNIIDDLQNQLKRKEWIENAKQNKFFLTGHSKGAATALLGTDKICKDNGGQAGLPKPTATYAFEPARSLTQEKANKDKDCFNNTWRFEYKDDIVTHVPLTKDVTGAHGKIIEIAYDFKKLFNKLPGLPIIPDYGSVGSLFYVDTNGTGKVISNQADNLNERVHSLDEHLDRLKVIVHKPDLDEVSHLGEAYLVAYLKPLGSGDRQEAFKQANKQAKDLLYKLLALDKQDQDQCQTQLSLVDDHILYYKWLTKANTPNHSNAQANVANTEMQPLALASCCTKESLEKVVQCVKEIPDR